MALAGAAVAVALVLSACSSSGGKPAGQSSVGSASEAAANGSAVSVIVIDSDSAAQSFKDSRAVVNALVEQINAKGGIKGHPIKVDFCSGGVDPNQSQQCAQKAVSGKYVATLSDFIAADSGATKTLDAGGVAQLNMLALTPEGYSCTTCFPVAGGAVTGSTGTIAECRDVVHAKRIGLAVIDVPAAHGLVGQTESILKSRGDGTKIAKTVYVPLTTSDFSPIIANFASANVDCISVGVPGLMELSFVRAAAAQNLKSALVTQVSASSVTDLQSLGSAADRLYFTSIYAQAGPAHDDLIALEKKAGVSTGADAAAQAYVAVKLFEGIANTITGDITRASVLAAAKQYKWDGGGLTAPVDLGAYHATALGPDFPRLITTAYYSRAATGKIQPLCGGAPVDVTKASTAC